MIKIFRNGSITFITNPLDKLPTIQNKCVEKLRQGLTSQYLEDYSIDEDNNFIELVTCTFNTLKEQIKQGKEINYNKLKDYLQPTTQLSNNLTIESIRMHSGVDKETGVVGKTRSLTIQIKHKEYPYLKNTFVINSKGGVNFSSSIETSEKNNLLEVLKDEETPVQERKEIRKYLKVLNKQYLQNFINEIKPYFEDLYKQTGVLSTQVVKQKKSTITNMRREYTGEPILCRSTHPTLRPEPYSFYGICPRVTSTGVQYMPIPQGKKDNAKGGWYIPCCQSLTSGKGGKKLSVDRYKEYLRLGFPMMDGSGREIPVNGKLESEEYEIGNPDVMGAVYRPGTTELESRRWVGLQYRSWDQLLNCVKNSGDQYWDLLLQQFKIKEIQSVQTIPSLVRNKILSLAGVDQSPFVFYNILSRRSITELQSDPYFLYNIPPSTNNAIMYISLNGTVYVFDNRNIWTCPGKSNPSLKGTLLSGWVRVDEKVRFYPQDICSLRGKKVNTLPYFDRNNQNNRFEKIRTDIMSTDGFKDPSNIVLDRDESRWVPDLIQGTKWILENTPSGGFVMVNCNQPLFLGRLNTKSFMWKEGNSFNQNLVTAELQNVDDKWTLFWGEGQESITTRDIAAISDTVPPKFLKQLTNKDEVFDFSFKLHTNQERNKWNKPPLFEGDFLSNKPWYTYAIIDTPKEYLLNVNSQLTKPLTKDFFTNVGFMDENPQTPFWRLTPKFVLTQNLGQPLPQPLFLTQR